MDIAVIGVIIAMVPIRFANVFGAPGEGRVKTELSLTAVDIRVCVCVFDVCMCSSVCVLHSVCMCVAFCVAMCACVCV